MPKINTFFADPFTKTTAPVIEFDPNRPGDYIEGLRDVLGFMESCREENAEWRDQHPNEVAFQRRFRDGQRDALILACAAIEAQIAKGDNSCPSVN